MVSGASSVMVVSCGSPHGIGLACRIGKNTSTAESKKFHLVVLHSYNEVIKLTNYKQLQIDFPVKVDG